MGDRITIAGQVIDLLGQGYSVDEIFKELRHRPGLGNVSRETVVRAINKVKGRGADSKMLLAIYETQCHMLGILEELAGYHRHLAAQRARTAERQLLKKASQTNTCSSLDPGKIGLSKPPA
jgi:hypothetical protein